MARRWVSRRNTRSATSWRQRNARRRNVWRARGRTRTRIRTQRTLARVYRNPCSVNRQLATLLYVQDISLDPTPNALGATGTNVWQFSGNNLYDPDTTGFGHQPMYFDNLMAVYQRYRVNFAQICVTVVNHSVNTATYNGTSVTTTPNYAYKMFISRDATSNVTNEYPADMNTFIEEGGSNIKWRFVAPSLNGKLPKLKHSLSPHRLANCGFRDEDLSGTSTTGPARFVYFYIGVTSADGVTNPPAVSLNVRIRYFCEFYDRRAIQAQQ